MKRVHLVSLGCSKNRVDSEVMVGLLQQGEYELVPEPDDADVIVVNTCSFIQPATEESIDTILEMSRFKEDDPERKLIVTGCMVQRYGASLEGELPEVDHFLGTGEYARIREVLERPQQVRTHADVPMYLHDELAPRVNSWSQCSAYLKISEGCDHRCAFCIIPQLRGRLRSRSIDSLVTEAQRLVDEGVVELNLVSQDSTAYGRDLRDGTDLGGLVRRLAEIDQLRWIRLHYAYPHGVPQSFLEALRDEEKLVPYIDIPLQHASGPMLKAMRRGVTRAGQQRILDRLRSFVPDVTLRTTFIVGFPGESDADFNELLDFVEEQRFDRVGVFTYSVEDGTAAAELPNQVPDEVKQQRQAQLMELQATISREQLQAAVGSTVDVLIEGLAEESELLLRGRTARQAPDVDGQVFIAMPEVQPSVGQILPMRITQAGEHDLAGELILPA